MLHVETTLHVFGLPLSVHLGRFQCAQEICDKSPGRRYGCGHIAALEKGARQIAVVLFC